MIGSKFTLPLSTAVLATAMLNDDAVVRSATSVKLSLRNISSSPTSSTADSDTTDKPRSSWSFPGFQTKEAAKATLAAKLKAARDAQDIHDGEFGRKKVAQHQQMVAQQQIVDKIVEHKKKIAEIEKQKENNQRWYDGLNPDELADYTRSVELNGIYNNTKAKWDLAIAEENLKIAELSNNTEIIFNANRVANAASDALMDVGRQNKLQVMSAQVLKQRLKDLQERKNTNTINNANPRSYTMMSEKSWNLWQAESQLFRDEQSEMLQAQIAEKNRLFYVDQRLIPSTGRQVYEGRQFSYLY